MRAKIIVLISFCCFFVIGCYEDKSATDFEIVNPINIDFWDNYAESQKVFQMDTLEIIPIIYKCGVDDSDLEYEWRIQGNDYPVTVLSDKLIFKQQITVAPNSNPYDLILTVTDKATSLKEFAKIRLTVESKFGEGLLVADTHDEITSDISLVMSPNFTRDLQEKNKRTHYNIYSLMNNGQKVSGVIHDIQSDIKSDSRVLTFMTETDIHRVDPYGFAAWQMNNDLFYVPLDDIKPGQLAKDDYGGDEYMTVNGKMHYRNSSWGNLYYSYYLFTPDNSDYQISYIAKLGRDYYAPKPFAYDELKNRLLQMNSYNDGFMQFRDQEPGVLFDVNNLGAYDAVYMDEGENANLNMVLKAEDGSGYFIFAMQTEVADNGSNLPVGLYNLSQCTDIMNVVAFASSPISEDFYYATENHVYALTLKPDQPNPISSVRYTTMDGDKITGMMIWKGEYQKMNVPDNSQPSGMSAESNHNRMLVLTTYNDSTKEGKVITIPIIRLGDGTLETNPAFHNVYDGFGRITKVAYNKVGY